MTVTMSRKVKSTQAKKGSRKKATGSRKPAKAARAKATKRSAKAVKKTAKAAGKSAKAAGEPRKRAAKSAKAVKKPKKAAARAVKRKTQPAGKPPTPQQILTDRFGHHALRPIQKSIITRIMDGGDALVVMPTGSGKSLCYQLPALALPRPGVTLVLSPLIALMEDQVSALKGRKIKAQYINSTVSRRQRERRCRRLAEGAYDLLYATPERMAKPEFIEALSRVPGGVKLLAIDEAHCISKWGHDLRPAYQEVGRFRRRLGNPITIALTATATRRVRDDIRRTLNRDRASMPLFTTPVDRPNLSFEVVEVWDDDAKLERLRRIAADGRGRGTGIVYFARIKDLDHLLGRAEKIAGRRPIEVYHGQLSPRQKKRVYDRFIKAEPDEGLVLFATNAFGMGVDKPDIRFIVHAQMPGSVEAYYQEVGRAGRDGRPARCMMFYAPDDLAIQQQFVEWMNPSADLLVRAAHAIEAHPHANFDAGELQVMVSGKARSETLGKLEHVLIALEKRGVIEPTSIIGRYSHIRPLRHDEVDARAVARKRKHDLQRLLDVVKLAKSGDMRRFVTGYFDLEENSNSPGRAEPPVGPRGRRRRRRRGRGAGSKATSKATARADKPAAKLRRRSSK